MLYVFTGPTLSKDEILNFHPSSIILDPIKSTDILNLLRHSSKEMYPTNILIIDGLFHGHLSIRHKEILYALDQGIQVWGCSSMGALRAAECSKFGMKGSGKIFNFFSNTLSTSDDEVAVSYLSERPFTEISLPLINLRFAIDSLRNNKIIDDDQSYEIINEIKSMHFSDRRFDVFYENKKLKPYIDLIKDNYINWKRLDALESLRKIHQSLENENTRTNDKWSLNQGMIPLNYYKDTYVNSSKDSKNLVGDDLVELIGVKEDGERLLYDSFNRLLTLRFAKFLKVEPTEEEINSIYLFLDNLIEQDNSYNLPFNCNYNDPTYKRKIAVQEATILKMHLWLKETLGPVGSSLPLQDYLTKLSTIRSNNKSSRESSLSEILKDFLNEEETDMLQVFFESQANSSNRQGRSNNHMDV